MNSKQQNIVSRMQDNLYTIRQLAGWSAEELAERLDVTKQTVYNLERGKPKMSWVQYLALTKLIEIEIEAQPDNKALQQAVVVLLNNKDLPEEEYYELQQSLKTIAKGMTKSSNRDIALKLALQTIAPVIAGGVAAGALLGPTVGLQAGFYIADAIMKGKEKDENKD